MAHIDNDAGTATSKRAEKTIRVFSNSAGEKSSRAKLDSVRFDVTFVENGATVGLAFDELTPEVQRAAALYGIMTSVTNTVGAKGLSVAEMVDNAEARLEVIRGGLWSSESKVGARTSDYVEALIRVFTAKGRAPNEEQVASWKTRLASDEAYRAAVEADVKVQAAVAAIRSERAQARLAEAAEKAKGAEDTNLDALA